MNGIVGNIIQFFLLIAAQVLVFNNIELGFGIMPMVYPLFIMFLPIKINIYILLILSFALGLSIDSFSDTFGIHASAMLIMAYFRPIILKTFEPRDGYEMVESMNTYTMGFKWFVSAFGVLLLIHHTWFFIFEIFNIREIFFILQKTILSTVFSFILCILIQFIFISRRKAR